MYALVTIIIWVMSMILAQILVISLTSAWHNSHEGIFFVFAQNLMVIVALAFAGDGTLKLLSLIGDKYE